MLNYYKSLKEFILISLLIITLNSIVQAQNNRWIELSSDIILFNGKLPFDPNFNSCVDISYYKLWGDSHDNIYLINPESKKKYGLYKNKMDILKIDESKMEALYFKDFVSENVTFLLPISKQKIYIVKYSAEPYGDRDLISNSLVYIDTSISEIRFPIWFFESKFFDNYTGNEFNEVSYICSNGNGNLFLLNHKLAKWDGKLWTFLDFESFDSGNAIKTKTCYSFMCVDKNGNLFVYSDFKTKDGTMHHIAKYDGNSWAELGLNSDPNKPQTKDGYYSIITDNMGNFYVAQKNHISKWDGEKWSELGGSGTSGLNANGDVYSVATDKEGNVYAAGAFTNNSHKRYVAKWDGKSWKELGEGSLALNANDNIYSIFVNSRNTVFATGKFTNKSKNRYVAIFKQGND